MVGQFLRIIFTGKYPFILLIFFGGGAVPIWVQFPIFFYLKTLISYRILLLASYSLFLFISIFLTLRAIVCSHSCGAIFPIRYIRAIFPIYLANVLSSCHLWLLRF